jgi:hypothetical protein
MDLETSRRAWSLEESSFAGRFRRRSGFDTVLGYGYPEPYICGEGVVFGWSPEYCSEFQMQMTGSMSAPPCISGEAIRILCRTWTKKG